MSRHSRLHLVGQKLPLDERSTASVGCAESGYSLRNAAMRDGRCNVRRIGSPTHKHRESRGFCVREGGENPPRTRRRNRTARITSSRHLSTQPLANFAGKAPKCLCLKPENLPRKSRGVRQWTLRKLPDRSTATFRRDHRKRKQDS